MLTSRFLISKHYKPDVAVHLPQLGQGQLEGLHMAVLLKHFVMSSVTLMPGEEDRFEHIANIICNITRIRTGRKLLLEPGRGLLQALAAQLQAPSLVRRRGASGAIRNCCVALAEDQTLDAVLQDEQVRRRPARPCWKWFDSALEAHVQKDCWICSQM